MVKLANYPIKDLVTKNEKQPDVRTSPPEGLLAYAVRIVSLSLMIFASRLQKKVSVLVAVVVGITKISVKTNAF